MATCDGDGNGGLAVPVVSPVVPAGGAGSDGAGPGRADAVALTPAQPDVPARTPSTWRKPVDSQQGPELMLAAATQHVTPAEKEVVFAIAIDVINAVLPNPYRAALEVARGGVEFRRDFARAFAVVARNHPQVCGRIDSSKFAMLAWQRAKMMVQGYITMATGLIVKPTKTWARRVIRDCEERMDEMKRTEKAPDEVEVEIVTDGAATLTGDGFIGSATKRSGTLHEIAEDYELEEHRQQAHRRIEEMGDEWRKAQAEAE